MHLSRRLVVLGFVALTGACGSTSSSAGATDAASGANGDSAADGGAGASDATAMQDVGATDGDTDGTGGTDGTAGGMDTTDGTGDTGGGTVACIPGYTCAQVIDDGDPAFLCEGTPSRLTYDAMFECMCTGKCAVSCSDSTCTQMPPSSSCSECLQDQVAGCGQEFGACKADI